MVKIDKNHLSLAEIEATIDSLLERDEVLEIIDYLKSIRSVISPENYRIISQLTYIIFYSKVNLDQAIKMKMAETLDDGFLLFVTKQYGEMFGNDPATVLQSIVLPDYRPEILNSRTAFSENERKELLEASPIDYTIFLRTSTVLGNRSKGIAYKAVEDVVRKEVYDRF